MTAEPTLFSTKSEHDVLFQWPFKVYSVCKIFLKFYLCESVHPMAESYRWGDNFQVFSFCFNMGSGEKTPTFGLPRMICMSCRHPYGKVHYNLLQDIAQLFWNIKSFHYKPFLKICWCVEYVLKMLYNPDCN